MVFSLLSKAVKGFASKVLVLDNTAVPKEQILLLQDFSSKYNFKIKKNSGMDELLAILKKKHLVDSITVARKDGSLITASEGNGSQEALTAAALLNHVNSELPVTESVLIKSANNWFMLLPLNGKIYIVKAAADLSVLEFKALAIELEKYLKEEIANNKVFKS